MLTTVVMYAGVGLLVGSLCIMLGIGGGVIIVPLMAFVFGASPQETVGTSMLVILFNTVSGTLGYARKRMVFWDAAWKFALATVPGAIIGGYVSDFIQIGVFYGLFGTLFILLAANGFRKALKHGTEDPDRKLPEKYNWKLGTVCSACVGFLASILGIGGGVIHVPVMTYILKFPIKTAVATSTAMMAVSAAASFATHAAMGHIVWIPALSMSAGALVGAQIGVMAASKSRSSLLTGLTALLQLAIGLKFLSGLL